MGTFSDAPPLGRGHGRGNAGSDGEEAEGDGRALNTSWAETSCSASSSRETMSESSSVGGGMVGASSSKSSSSKSIGISFVNELADARDRATAGPWGDAFPQEVVHVRGVVHRRVPGWRLRIRCCQCLRHEAVGDRCRQARQILRALRITRGDRGIDSAPQPDDRVSSHGRRAAIERAAVRNAHVTSSSSPSTGAGITGAASITKAFHIRIRAVAPGSRPRARQDMSGCCLLLG